MTIVPLVGSSVKMDYADNNVNSYSRLLMRSSEKRLRRTPEEARRLILDTAQELIARNGPEGLRLQEIAAAAGISHPLILHHFGSREGLVRALVQQAVDELRDKLIPAMGSAASSLEQELDQVFDAYRDGLAQRLAWLATIDPTGEAISPAAVMRDIADSLHARRAAAAPAGDAPDRADTEMLVHLIAVAAFGDGIVGRRLWRSAGLPATDDTDGRFRRWLAALIREHSIR